MKTKKSRRFAESRPVCVDLKTAIYYITTEISAHAIYIYKCFFFYKNPFVLYCLCNVFFLLRLTFFFFI